MSWRHPKMPGVPDRPLATARVVDGRILAATMSGLYVVEPGALGNQDPQMIAWEQIATADWERDNDQLRLKQVSGEETTFHVDDEARTFLGVVRERVSASVVLIRQHQMPDGRSFRVVGRRAPGSATIRWGVESGPELDVHEPEVAAYVGTAVRAARDEVGL